MKQVQWSWGAEHPAWHIPIFHPGCVPGETMGSVERGGELKLSEAIIKSCGLVLVAIFGHLSEQNLQRRPLNSWVCKLH